MKTLCGIKAYQQGILGLLDRKVSQSAKPTVNHPIIQKIDNSYLRRMGLNPSEIKKCAKSWII